MKTQSRQVRTWPAVCGHAVPAPGGTREGLSQVLRQSGFTLLEVMVALAVLALVGLAAIQSSGRNLMGMADTARRDAVFREGRNRFYEILTREMAKPEDRRELNHWGTLAPEFPDVDWAMRKVRLSEFSGYRLEFSMKDRLSNGQEQWIDYVLPH